MATKEIYRVDGQPEIRAICEECGDVLVFTRLADGRLPPTPHGCRPVDPCGGCGVRGCSAQALHEAVAASPGVRTHQARVEVLREHGITLPATWGRDAESDRFVESIANALERYRAQLQGLPEPQAIEVNPPADAAQLEHVREEFRKRYGSERESAAAQAAGYTPELSAQLWGEPTAPRTKCGECSGRGHVGIFMRRECEACGGTGHAARRKCEYCGRSVNPRDVMCAWCWGEVEE